MNRAHKLAFIACIFWVCVVGCGVNPTSIPPENGPCTGVLISGILKDSLTGYPVAQGQVFLESGSQVSIIKLYNFVPIKQVTTKHDGTFQICVSSLGSPSVIVAAALDSSNYAYPPFVATVSRTMNFGTIPMGGCLEKCAFDGQQQTSLPATITGAIITTPNAETGTVLPLYSMNALDGSSNIWSLTMPNYNTSQSFSFTTASASCIGKAPFCESYTFVLPSQKPVWLATSGTMQQTGVPVYSIYAAAPACTPSAFVESFQTDGHSPLLATPGVNLSTATMNFSSCN